MECNPQSILTELNETTQPKKITTTKGKTAKLYPLFESQNMYLLGGLLGSSVSRQSSAAAFFGSLICNAGSIKHQSWYAMSPLSIPAFSQNTVPPVTGSFIRIAHSIAERPRWRGNQDG